jgi:MFS family permease
MNSSASAVIAPSVMAPASRERAPPPGLRLSAKPKYRMLAAGLGFSVIAQTTVSILATAVPVIAPEIAKFADLDVKLIAFWFPLVYIVALFSNFAAPKLVHRFGGAGLSLGCIGAGTAGLLLVLPSVAVLIVAAPLLLGFGVGVITPATSQVVGPHATPRTAGLIMSIRASAVPAGSMLAGIVMPILAIYWGWHAVLVVALASAGLMIILLPAVHRLNHGGSTLPAALRPLEPVKRLLAMAGMWQLLFAIVTFLMLSMCLRSFFTVYLVKDLGFDLATAGLAYSAPQLAGVVGMVACAVVSDRWLSPRTVMAINGALVTAAAVFLANFTRGWPIVVIAFVAAIIGFCAIGSLPVMLGEVTRRSPPGQVGAMVSGGNIFINAGCVLGPLLFGAVGIPLGYSGGFVALAICTAVGAIVVAPLSLRRTPSCVEATAETAQEPVRPRPNPYPYTGAPPRLEFDTQVRPSAPCLATAP